ncbi:response regulator [Polaromonas sp. P1(28)-13]|nr:response regulator [Polaromonas sp. P1(28)-13]
MKILLVEDDFDLSGALVRVLVRRGFEVMHCGDGIDALKLAKHHNFAAILLDLSIPGIDGLRVLQRLRDADDATPVLILTARGAVGDRVMGLNAGADDYLAKPFDLDELEARLRAIIRRKGGDREIRCGALRYEKASGACFRDEKPLDLSPRETALLKALMAQPGQGVAKERLMALVFPTGEVVQADAIEVVVHRLRRKIAGSGAEIMTLRGVGYLLCEGAALAPAGSAA